MKIFRFFFSRGDRRTVKKCTKENLSILFEVSLKIMQQMKNVYVCFLWKTVSIALAKEEKREQPTIH